MQAVVQVDSITTVNNLGDNIVIAFDIQLANNTTFRKFMDDCSDELVDVLMDLADRPIETTEVEISID